MTILAVDPRVRKDLEQQSLKTANGVTSKPVSAREPSAVVPAPPGATVASSPSPKSPSAVDYAIFLKWEAEQAGRAPAPAPAAPAPNTIEAFEAEWASNHDNCRARAGGYKQNYVRFRQWEVERESRAQTLAAAPAPTLEDFEAEWAQNAGGCRQHFRANKNNYIGYRRWQTSQWSGVACH